jgi:hypothetical protein
MAPEIHIYSNLHLGQSCGNLEDDIQAHFEGDIEVSGGGQGQAGWNVDLELLDEEADVHRFAKKLIKFLLKWGVPRDTYLKVFTSDWKDGQEAERIDVFDSPAMP